MAWKKTLPLIFIIISIAAFWISGLSGYLNTESLLSARDTLQAFIDNNIILAALMFGLAYIAIVALSLPFATFMTLAAGLLFGWMLGTFIVVIAATGGATIIFMIAKSSFGEILRAKAGKIYKKVEDDMQDNAASYLLFLRLVPLFPFFLVNIVPALFNVKTRTYIWTTALGILPGTAIYVNVGRSLGEVDNPTDLISRDLILSVALLGVIAMLPRLHKLYRNRKGASS
jgi:uncharacterized membrane protein YdjX (TVP38/TMEM64 family)